MTKKGEKDYRPSHIYIDGEAVYWDKMVVRQGGFTSFYVAWGDGAHCCYNAYLDSCGCLELTDVAYHTGQLEDLVSKADYIRCELDYAVTYKRGEK